MYGEVHMEKYVMVDVCGGPYGEVCDERCMGRSI